MKPIITTAAVLLGVSSISLTAALAQETSNSDEIVVTGSFIKRKNQKDIASPLNVVDRASIDSQAVLTTSDLVKNLTVNTGSEFNSNTFTQQRNAGTSQINLRGLGLNSTLTLLNGKRQTLSASVSNAGGTFVDVNSLVPLIAVERIETLKDGAAALYGSDAVAGVANFITRNEFEGFELQGDFQLIPEGSQKDTNISGIFGASFDRGNIVAAISWMDRTPLLFAERSFSENAEVSTLGQPGAIQVGPPPFVVDPSCPTAPVGPGLCPIAISPFFSLVAEENRLQGYSHFNYDLTDTVEFSGEFGFARNRAEQSNTPTFPLLNFPTIPASNPSNFAGATGIFTGRPIGADGDPIISTTDSDTWRAGFDLSGDFNESWDWSLGFGYSENQFVYKFADTLIDRFDAALNGMGGPNNDQYWDISAGALNPPELIDDVLGESVYDGEADLAVVDAVITGDTAGFLELPGGPVGVAIGGQFRQENLSVDFDDDSNAFNFAFLQGANDFEGTRDVYAGFIEVSLPVTNTLNIQAAGRYESLGNGLDTLDPKVAVLWTPTDRLAFRGSYSTSFRVPSLYQTVGEQTALESITDPLNPGPPLFIAVVTAGDPTLQPETSRNFNVGFTAEPVDGVSLDVDYWNFSFTDVIVKQNAQALVNAAAAGDPVASAAVIRNAGTGIIQSINPSFVNASSIDTDGIDATLSAGFGDFSVNSTLTYVLNYELQESAGGPVIEGAGNRNSINFSAATPRLRNNTSFNWSSGSHSATAIVRVIGSYTNDDADGFGDKIGEHITLDLQYAVDLSDALGFGEGTRLAFGSNNVLNNEPPFVASSQGYDPTVHDPRGRIVYVRLNQRF